MSIASHMALLMTSGGGNDAYVSLLLHMDGADASTTFTDSSQFGKTVNVNGNAQIDTAQLKFGSASGLFDGTGDFLRLDGSADFAFGTGDFTIDFWFRPNATASVAIYDSRPTGTNGLYPTIITDASNHVIYFTNSANRITGTTALSTATWYHIAVARTGTSTKLFINGTQEGSTYSDSNNYINGTSRPEIGAAGTDSTFGTNGWLDELRVSKGIARWTANFTTPTVAYS